MENFKHSDTYIVSQFSDVNEAAWYGEQQQAVIKTVFNLGIMNGMGNGAFSPDGNLKISEAIKMAAVVHSIYNGDKATFDVSSQPWYQGYVNYAITNSIITANDFPDYDAYATRAQMAHIFANALPAAELQQINTINSVADVSTGTMVGIKYSDSILSLYRAGVFLGDAGTRNFRPNDYLSRTEAAAIAARIAVPADRQHFEILPDNADIKSHGPTYAIYNASGESLALGYQSANILKTFFNEEPVNTIKYPFTDGANIYRPEYQGFGKVTYVLSDYSAGGIYVY